MCATSSRAANGSATKTRDEQSPSGRDDGPLGYLPRGLRGVVALLHLRRGADGGRGSLQCLFVLRKGAVVSDITGNDKDRHNWKRSESLQWGSRDLHYETAQTPYKCARCGK